MNIAISFRHDMPVSQLVHGNGISQNIKFLYDLLELLGHKPYFLLFGDEAQHDSVLGGKQYRNYTFRHVIDTRMPTALALEIAVTLEPDHRADLREACGAKIVCVRYGNTMIMDIEESIFHDRPKRTLYYADPDALWISPHFVKSKSYFEALYGCEAQYCPYIWEPDFVSGQFKASDVSDVRDIYVMEPNINVMKTAMVPVCIVSELFRDAPDSFGRATVINGDVLQKNAFFLNNIIRNLPGTSAEHDKLFFSGRCTFDEAFRRPDILLGHHWHCGLNYLYLEAIYKGVTLVHNSEYLEFTGYYYPDFEIHRGKDACLSALAEKPTQEKMDNDRKILYRFSIHNPTVQQAYRELIESTLDSKAA